MKYALCNELFETRNAGSGFDFPRVFDYIKQTGYDGAEIAPFTMAATVQAVDTSQRTAVRRAAEHAGLTITGLHWLLAKTEGYYLTSPDAEVRKRTADYFVQLVQLCADLGGQFMVLGSPKQRNLLPSVSQEQAFDYAAEVLSRVVPALEKYNVKIAVEPLARKETDFLTTAAETVQLIERIGVPRHIALHLDCKAMSDESVPIPELIQQNKEHLIYFHANDPNLQGPGFGTLDFAPILQALRDVEYNGWVSVEVFDYSLGVNVLAEKSLDYLKSVDASAGV
ncbi:MAG: sugar phosphate isomerase/epimerase [Planctomycetaceae bacterium]|nr:sugar phosphate isomerase/epimerase [Planctomycetaceae bacterium]